jgi:hypothetical protein
MKIDAQTQKHRSILGLWPVSLFMICLAVATQSPSAKAARTTQKIKVCETYLEWPAEVRSEHERLQEALKELYGGNLVEAVDYTRKVVNKIYDKPDFFPHLVNDFKNFSAALARLKIKGHWASPAIVVGDFTELTPDLTFFSDLLTIIQLGLRQDLKKIMNPVVKDLIRFYNSAAPMGVAKSYFYSKLIADAETADLYYQRAKKQIHFLRDPAVRESYVATLSTKLLEFNRPKQALEVMEMARAQKSWFFAGNRAWAHCLLGASPASLHSEISEFTEEVEKEFGMFLWAFDRHEEKTVPVPRLRAYGYLMPILHKILKDHRRDPDYTDLLSLMKEVFWTSSVMSNRLSSKDGLGNLPNYLQHHERMAAVFGLLSDDLIDSDWFYDAFPFLGLAQEDGQHEKWYAL